MSDLWFLDIALKKKVGEGEAHGWRREIPGMLILNYQIQLSPKY